MTTRVTLPDGSLLDLDDAGAPVRMFTVDEFRPHAVEHAEEHVCEPLDVGTWEPDPENTLGEGTQIAMLSVCAPENKRQSNRMRLPNLGQDELREFVLGLADGAIFTNWHLGKHEENLVSMVFLPIAFGAFENVEKFDLKKLGVIWEWIHKAGPRGINGHPMFYSMHVMNFDDWVRAHKAARAEAERRKTVEI